jgi:hypothetical protein
MRLAVIACCEIFVGPNYLDSDLLVDHLPVTRNGLSEVGIGSDLLKTQLDFLVDKIVVASGELRVNQLLQLAFGTHDNHFFSLSSFVHQVGRRQHRFLCFEQKALLLLARLYLETFLLFMLFISFLRYQVLRFSIESC